MIRAVALVLSLAPVAAFAQASGAQQPGSPMMMHGQPMMMHMDHSGQVASAAPRDPGQAAFAAIQEIVEILSADPRDRLGKGQHRRVAPASRRHE